MTATRAKRTEKEGAVVAPKKAKAPFEIYTPAESARHLKFGVYGRSGVGKTTLAATAPSPLYMNIERGDAALIGKDIDIVTVQTMKEVQQVHAFLATGKHEYESVVIDSLTDLHRGLLEEASSREGNEVPQRQNYMLAMEQIIRIVRAFRDLPMHVVFVMGLKERQDQGTGAIQLQPDLSGQLATKIPGYVDVFALMEMVPVRGKVGHFTRGLQLQPGPRWFAKDRTGTLGSSLGPEQLDLNKIVELVRKAQRLEGESELIDDEVALAAERAAKNESND